MAWSVRDPVQWARLIERVVCCEAGKRAFPYACPWHGEDGRRPRPGDPSELVEALLYPQRLRPVQSHWVDGDDVEDTVEQEHILGSGDSRSTDPPPEAPFNVVGPTPAGRRVVELEQQLVEIRQELGLQDRLGHSGLLEVIREVRQRLERLDLPVDAPSPAARRAVELEDRLSAVKVALGLEPTADLQAILTAIDHQTSVVTKTTEEMLRERSQRQDAMHAVMDLWSQHRLGEEPAVEDLIGVADWLVTGRTDAMTQAIQVRAEAYYSQQAGPDAARWSPGDR